MTSGVEHCMAAKGHVEEGGNMISSIIDKLHEVMGYIQSTADRSTDLAANHMFEVANEVGSDTANTIGVELVDISRQIDQANAEGLQHTIDYLAGLIDRMELAKDRIEDLTGLLAS